MESKGQWRADQGQQNPAAWWQGSSAVKASNGVLLRVLLMPGSWPCIRFIVLAQASFFRLPVDSVGYLYTLAGRAYTS